jgi:hypothetical protein
MRLSPAIAHSLVSTAALVATTAIATTAAWAQEPVDRPHDVEVDVEQQGSSNRRASSPVPPVADPPPSSSSPPPKAAPANPPKQPPAGPPKSPYTTTHPAYRTLPDQPWRQASRRDKDDDDSIKVFEPKHVVFEMRFGPYLPKVDSEPGLTGTPYADYFGTSSKFYFGLELDWLPLRVPFVGSLGLAYGWGTVGASAKTKTTTGAEAGSDTKLRIYPMYAVGVFRIDGLLRHARVPVVPYVKAGVGIGVWTSTGPNGTSSSNGVSATGVSPGFHLGLGGALALNAFDRRTAMSMHEATGIRYAYLWGEWMFNNLTNFGKHNVMHVGTSTGVAGLGIEFY